MHYDSRYNTLFFVTLYQIKVHILMKSSRNPRWLPVYKLWYIFYTIQSWGKYEKVNDHRCYILKKCSLLLNLNSHTDYQKHIIQFIFKDGYHFTKYFTLLYIVLPMRIAKTCNQLWCRVTATLIIAGAKYCAFHVCRVATTSTWTAWSSTVASTFY